MSPVRDADRARTAARRAVARRLHPDMGGDTAAYLDALAALDAAPAWRPVPAAPVTFRRTRWSRARSGLRRQRRRWLARHRSSRYTEL
ncbi:hypothetical protein [Lapillicoccus sp.]|uniref:hypothetical protein n=1 Tax=Lapillicoccus sp. TaxID=1909287 RepID=UPI0025D1ABDF|nr:hypothetical protein [Lapillicoccus sp.]